MQKVSAIRPMTPTPAPTVFFSPERVKEILQRYEKQHNEVESILFFGSPGFHATESPLTDDFISDGDNDGDDDMIPMSEDWTSPLTTTASKKPLPTDLLSTVFSTLNIFPRLQKPVPKPAAVAAAISAFTSRSRTRSSDGSDDGSSDSTISSLRLEDWRTDARDKKRRDRPWTAGHRESGDGNATGGANDPPDDTNRNASPETIPSGEVFLSEPSFLRDNASVDDMWGWEDEEKGSAYDDEDDDDDEEYVSADDNEDQDDFRADPRNPSIILSEASPSDDGHGRDEWARRRRMHKPLPRKVAPAESALSFSPCRRSLSSGTGSREGSDLLLAPRVVHLSPRRRPDAAFASPCGPSPLFSTPVRASEPSPTGGGDAGDGELLRVFGSGRSPPAASTAAPASPSTPRSPLSRRKVGALRVTPSTAFSSVPARSKQHST